jgi:hypothetical protein
MYLIHPSLLLFSAEIGEVLLIHLEHRQWLHMGLRGSGLRTAIALAAGLCFVAFGYGQSDFGGLLTVSSFRERFPQIDTVGRPNSSHVAVIQGITNATWNIGV